MIAINNRAFIATFAELERWDVTYFRKVDWEWEDEFVQPLGSVLHRKKVDVKDYSDLTAVPIIGKISFGGVLSLLDVEDREGYKGRLFWADTGDFIYSKIRAKQGSFCIVSPEIGRVAVSNEYPVYAVDITKVDSAYIALVIRSRAFLRYLEGLSHGGSTKTRIAPTEFEKLCIPVPPLPVQQAIVSHYQTAQREAAIARRNAEQREKLIEVELLRHLGIPPRQVTSLPKAFVLQWEDLERWSVGYLARLQAGLNDAYKSQYTVKHLGAIARISYGIQKSPANRPGQNARPYLRVANVQAGRLNLNEIKEINVEDSEMEAFRLKRDDLLVCEGNSADLVGRPAIWNDEIPDCIHQNHILKVRVDPNIALPRYVLEYMQTLPARTYFRARAKFTTNLASINSNDLRELAIPLPPLEVQEVIVAQVQAGRAEIAREKQRAETLIATAKADVEAMISGTKPPPMPLP